jgi:hypothetical protein
VDVINLQKMVFKQSQQIQELENKVNRITLSTCPINLKIRTTVTVSTEKQDFKSLILDKIKRETIERKMFFQTVKDLTECVDVSMLNEYTISSDLVKKHGITLNDLFSTTT